MREGRRRDLRGVREQPHLGQATFGLAILAEPLKLDAGGTVTAKNRGGEFHTFTEVAEFGGGCVEEINDLMGLEAVPECANAGFLFGTTGVPPGGSLTTGPLSAGTHNFMCIIHPSQRTTIVAN